MKVVRNWLNLFRSTPHMPQTHFGGPWGPYATFFALFGKFRIFHYFHLKKRDVFKVLSKPDFSLRIHQKVVKPAQNQLETLPRCPRDTLETHSTPPGHILGPEGSNLQKSTFCVVPTSLKPASRRNCAVTFKWAPGGVMCSLPIERIGLGRPRI